MEICSILHHSSKDLIVKLFAIGVEVKIWGCDWKEIIWIEPIHMDKGRCYEYKGIPFFKGGRVKPDGNHIVIDCEDDEDLFFWTILHTTEAYNWAFEVQGYGEKRRKKREKAIKKHQERIAKYNPNNSPYAEEAKRIEARNSAKYKELIQSFNEIDEIDTSNGKLKI